MPSDHFRPLRIDTPRAFIRYRYELGLHCRACERWTVADLQQLVDMGKGDQSIIGMRFVCKLCRAPMSAQVRPPVPER